MNVSRATVADLLAAGALLVLALHLAPAGPVSAAAILVYLSVGPGLALALLAGLRDQLTIIVASLALSLSLVSISALVMLYSGAWSPDLTLVVLAAVGMLPKTRNALRRSRSTA